MRIFRKATIEDLEQCWSIVDAARWQMIRIGRRQWTPEYPSCEVLTADIGAGAGFVIEEESGDEVNCRVAARCIVAYGAVYRNGEPEYERLRGNWLSHGDYLVVHRLAVDPKRERCGIAREFFANVERMALSCGINSVKVDTNYDNAGMLHILATTGYTYCGEVTYPVSGERLAYEKKLIPGNPNL